jgi:hypothetical protein
MRLFKEIGKEYMSCELLGVIVCNTISDQDNVSFPHVNMAIPLRGLKRALENVLQERKQFCEEFYKQFKRFIPIPESVPSINFIDDRKAVQSLWNFEIPASEL